MQKHNSSVWEWEINNGKEGVIVKKILNDKLKSKGNTNAFKYFYWNKRC